MERTLLLVDDEENITSALVRLLRRDGYRILRANSGMQGLELLAQNKVDVIISDQRMPGMTGAEFLSKVRELYPDTVRIMLSGYTELNSVTDAINRGAIYKFLTKPWEDDLLRANVEEAFQRYEMKIENLRLNRELQQANDKLRAINQELEQRVESKTYEIVRNLGVLRVTQEMFEAMPVVAIGIDEDGLIVVANQIAHVLFSAVGSGSSLLGEAADTIIPAEILAWAASGPHRRFDDAQSFCVAGYNLRCWCRTMGKHTRSHGLLMVMDAGPQIKALQAGQHHRRRDDARNDQ